LLNCPPKKTKNAECPRREYQLYAEIDRPQKPSEVIANGKAEEKFNALQAWQTGR